MSALAITPELARELAAKSVAQAFPGLEPGVGFLSIAQTAKFLGLSEAHLRNLISEDRCPFPTVLFGARRLVLATAVIDLVASALSNGGIVLDPKPVAPSTPPAAAPSAPTVAESGTDKPEKRGRGRPAKKESTKARRRAQAQVRAAARA